MRPILHRPSQCRLFLILLLLFSLLIFSSLLIPCPPPCLPPPPLPDPLSPSSNFPPSLPHSSLLPLSLCAPSSDVPVLARFTGYWHIICIPPGKGLTVQSCPTMAPSLSATDRSCGVPRSLAGSGAPQCHKPSIHSPSTLLSPATRRPLPVLANLVLARPSDGLTHNPYSPPLVTVSSVSSHPRPISHLDAARPPHIVARDDSSVCRRRCPSLSPGAALSPPSPFQWHSSFPVACSSPIASLCPRLVWPPPALCACPHAPSTSLSTAARPRAVPHSFACPHLPSLPVLATTCVYARPLLHPVPLPLGGFHIRVCVTGCLTLSCCTDLSYSPAHAANTFATIVVENALPVGRGLLSIKSSIWFNHITAKLDDGPS